MIRPFLYTKMFFKDDKKIRDIFIMSCCKFTAWVCTVMNYKRTIQDMSYILPLKNRENRSVTRANKNAYF